MNLLNIEKFKTVTVRGMKFKIHFISPKDDVIIRQRRIDMQKGAPLASLSESDYTLFENIAICNTCIDEYPSGINDNVYVSCTESFPDIDLINEVAKEITDYTEEIKSKLKKNKLDIGG